MRQTSAYRSRRARRRQRSRVLGVGILLVLVSLIASAAFFFWWMTSDQMELDRDTMCPTDAPPAGYHAILIDSTDSFNEIQRAFIQRELQSFFDAVEPGHLLSLYALDSLPTRQLEPEFALCNPGRPASGLSDWLYQNPRELEKRWRAEFHAPLTEVLSALLAADEKASSPIMEMLQAVSVSAFGQVEDSGVVRKKRLMIVSDLLQNTSAYSHYSGNRQAIEEFLVSPAFQQVRADLTGVQVHVLYVRRSYGRTQGVQGRRHIRFWEQLISSMGGSLQSVTTIPG